MSRNTFGNLFRLTTFGESHGPAIGGIIDGCPAGLELDLDALQTEMNRRRPGQSSIVTQRNEQDEVNFLSGIFEGVTTGSPIGFIIENKNQDSKDYSNLQNAFRPSHADYTYQKKYGLRDYRGGGRSSARETSCWVAAGAIAKQVLKDINFTAYVSSVGDIRLSKSYSELDFLEIEKNAVRCPDPIIADRMESYIKEIKGKGDTIGGVVDCVIQNVPIGLGEPVFDKLHAQLAKAMMSINAVKGFEYGSGFEGTRLKGSEHNDVFNSSGGTRTNFSGGIQGGISNGEDIYFKVAFKPVATIMQPQESIDEDGKIIRLHAKGRHDPCVVPRAVPIVEAMAAMVLLDFWLLNKSSKL